MRLLNSSIQRCHSSLVVLVLFGLTVGSSSVPVLADSINAAPNNAIVQSPLATNTVAQSADVRTRFPLISNTFLKVDVPLRHRPDGDDLSPVVPRGQAVALLGKAKDSKGQWWYRVIWSSKQGDIVGWIKADNTDFPNDKLAPLRPPPPCAKYLTAVPGAKKWVNSDERDLVVLTDLYRLTPQGTYPAAKFKVLVNGKQDARWTRPIKPSNGQLLLGRGAAINMGTILANSELGYALETTSADRVALFTTIYAVPDGCEFKTDD